VSRLGRLAAATLVLLAVPTVAPPAASAHPLGNFTINHYVAVTASPTAIQVELVTDYAEIPSIELLAELDANGDGSLDASEADVARRDLCASATDALEVAAEGAPVSLDLWAAGIDQADGAGGLATVRIVCELRASVDLAAGESLAIGFNPDADRIGWREIVARGDRLRVDPADASRDVSRRLTDYPERLLEQPLDERSLTVTLLPGGEPLAAAPLDDAQPLAEVAPKPEPAAGLPGLANLGAGAALLGLLAAAVAGAGHAVSPGHGKTVMAAYLVASRGGVRHALLLGAAVTVSHTLGVLLLAAIALLGSDVLPPERLYPVLSVASGLAVIGIGAWLLAGCVRRYRARRAHDHAHAHGHAHDHGHDHGAADGGELPGIRGLIAIGAAGGLVPSSAALVLLLAAISAGQPAYGLAVAVAFGLGMAIVLSGIGLAIVHGRERLAGWRGLGGGATLARVSALAPWVMATTVLVGGMVLTGQAFVTRL
jgi:ABC-type nickel/cobalt efflux system permease component RcnA